MADPGVVLKQLPYELVRGIYKAATGKKSEKSRKTDDVNSLVRIIKLTAAQTCLDALGELEERDVAGLDVFRRCSDFSDMAEKLYKTGLESFLVDIPVTTIWMLAAVYGNMALPQTDTVGAAKALGTRIAFVGFYSFVHGLPTKLVQRMCFELGLCKDPKPEQPKALLVKAVCTLNMVETVQPKMITFVREKLPIGPNSTYDDIFQHYYANEIRDYCKNNNISTSGKKQEMIKRIIASFHPEEETAEKSKKPKKKKRKT